MLKTRIFLFIYLSTICLSFTAAQEGEKEIVMTGIYGHPGPLWKAGYRLSELGVNAVFVHSRSVDSVMLQRARLEGAKVYAEFATLNGKGYVDKFPEAHAIDENGKRVKSAGWFMGVCPSNQAFQNYRFDQLRDLLTKFDLDGVWMDYVHWHAQFEEPTPILPETCFCGDCLSDFSEQSGIRLEGESLKETSSWILTQQDEAWRKWRCQVIASWVKKIKSLIADLRPDALLGLYYCPWEDDEFKQARQRILGLDLDMLSGLFDVFSPMVYHGRMGRKPEWVAKNISWQSERLDIDIAGKPMLWPIVQAYDEPHAISAREFAIVLQGGLSANATGVMMFTTQSVAKDEAKLLKMKEIYLARR